MGDGNFDVPDSFTIDCIYIILFFSIFQDAISYINSKQERSHCLYRKTIMTIHTPIVMHVSMKSSGLINLRDAKATYQ